MSREVGQDRLACRLSV